MIKHNPGYQAVPPWDDPPKGSLCVAPVRKCLSPNTAFAVLYGHIKTLLFQEALHQLKGDALKQDGCPT